MFFIVLLLLLSTLIVLLAFLSFQSYYCCLLIAFSLTELFLLLSNALACLFLYLDIAFLIMLLFVLTFILALSFSFLLWTFFQLYYQSLLSYCSLLSSSFLAYYQCYSFCCLMLSYEGSSFLFVLWYADALSCSFVASLVLFLQFLISCSCFHFYYQTHWFYCHIPSNLIFASNLTKWKLWIKFMILTLLFFSLLFSYNLFSALRSSNLQ